MKRFKEILNESKKHVEYPGPDWNGYKTTMVPIRHIETNPYNQKIDPDVVNSYRKVLKNPERYEPNSSYHAPVILSHGGYRTNRPYFISDGHHRLRAHKLEKRTHIKSIVDDKGEYADLTHE